MPTREQKIEHLIRTYERYVAPFTFMAGFALDAFTLKRIDLWFDHIIILFFLILAGSAITIFTLYEAGKLRNKIVNWGIAFVPVVMQFSFGGLFSAFVFFYVISASFAKSWLFLLVLVILLVGNERFRMRYQRLLFRMSIYFIAIFSYSIFLLPVLFGRMGTSIFIFSGVVSLALIVLFVTLLSVIIPQLMKESRKALAKSIFCIYIIFNIFYFTNIIPPVPLSLKGGGVYHSVLRTSAGDYVVRFEKSPWYLPLQETSPIYHKKQGESVYYFTSIFSPTKLNIPVFHRWSYYDSLQKKWVEKEIIGFPIVGGRDGGYRGYSFKTSIESGDWRVETITEQKQVLGRMKFSVVETDSEFILEEATH